MRAYRLGLFLATIVVCAASDVSSDPTGFDAVSADIKEVCTQPATAGQHWSIAGTAQGQVNVQVSNAQQSGKFSFTREEWSGVQAVLAADQATDNASYRHCVETLTAVFLAKLPTPPRDQTEIARRLNGFLLSNHLAIPGRTYTDAALSSGFSVYPMQNPINLSFSVLSGSYRGLGEVINNPQFHRSRIFLEKDGVIIGVVISQSCSPSFSRFCADAYNNWKSSIEQIESTLAVQQLSYGGGSSGPFAKKGTSTELVAYDDQWRVYIDRQDDENSGGPSGVNLVVATNQQ